MRRYFGDLLDARQADTQRPQDVFQAPSLLRTGSREHNVLLMSSSFRARLRQLVGIYVAVNLCALLVWAVYGVATGLVPHGGIDGYSGSAVEQLAWYAIGSTLFTTAVFGLPVLIAAVVVTWLGHRTSASG